MTNLLFSFHLRTKTRGRAKIMTYRFPSRAVFFMSCKKLFPLLIIIIHLHLHDVLSVHTFLFKQETPCSVLILYVILYRYLDLLIYSILHPRSTPLVIERTSYCFGSRHEKEGRHLTTVFLEIFLKWLFDNMRQHDLCRLLSPCAALQARIIPIPFSSSYI
jgi:hypothetical protein